jgi:hypothetical protein
LQLAETMLALAMEFSRYFAGIEGDPLPGVDESRRQFGACL